MPLPWKRTPPANLSPEEKAQSRTEKIAYELYQIRQLLNRTGDTHTDWEIAERIVQSRLRLALYRCHRPLIRLEKNTWEPLLAWANNQALLSLLGLVGNVGLIIAVATYIGSEKHRRNAEVLNAWQTITSAHGQAGSGGRIQALEFLNASPGANWRRKFPWVCDPFRFCLWSAESLKGIDLSVENSHGESHDYSSTRSRPLRVYLQKIQLPRADLWDANLAGADLWDANLAGANLTSANLTGVDLFRANLTEAYLRNVNLTGASLTSANLTEVDLMSATLVGADLRHGDLTGASLTSANLTGVDLTGAILIGADLSWSDLTNVDLISTDLTGASLWKANLTEASLNFADLTEVDLSLANLTGADLSLANLTGTDLGFANLEGAKSLTTEQLAQAKLCNTKLPEDIELSPDRDCREIYRTK